MLNPPKILIPITVGWKRKSYTVKRETNPDGGTDKILQIMRFSECQPVKMIFQYNETRDRNEAQLGHGL